MGRGGAHSLQRNHFPRWTPPSTGNGIGRHNLPVHAGKRPLPIFTAISPSVSSIKSFNLKGGSQYLFVRKEASVQPVTQGLIQETPDEEVVSGDSIQRRFLQFSRHRRYSKKIKFLDQGADSLKSAAEYLIDALRDPAAVVLVSSPGEGKVSLIAAFTPGVVELGIQAGKFIGPIAKMCDGGGGGRPNFVQAGGRKPKNLSSALENAKSA